MITKNYGADGLPENTILNHSDAIEDRHRFRKVSYEGEIWDLTHLTPFVFKESIQDQLIVDVVVIFSCHCFTREPIGEEKYTVPNEYWYIDEFEARILDPERYALSRKFLLKIVQELRTRYIKATGGETANYMTIEVADESEIPMKYIVFFDVKKDNKRRKRIILRIQSAHTREELTNRMKSGKKINFSVLLKAIYEGRKIKP